MKFGPCSKVLFGNACSSVLKYGERSIPEVSRHHICRSTLLVLEDLLPELQWTGCAPPAPSETLAWKQGRVDRTAVLNHPTSECFVRRHSMRQKHREHLRRVRWNFSLKQRTPVRLNESLTRCIPLPAIGRALFFGALPAPAIVFASRADACPVL